MKLVSNSLTLKPQAILPLAISASLGLPLSAQASFPPEIELSSLDGHNGLIINGEAASNFSGRSVSAAGDINGDGIDDLIIGAIGAGPKGSPSGRSYVLFGSTSVLQSPFNLSTLNGLNGFTINGETANDRSGISVSAAGDINGDGIDDVIIGAYRADPNSTDSGRSYVVFGSNTGLPNPFNLSTLNGLNGFAIDGEAANDRSGFSVSAAGDINGDSIDDLIIGAPFADPNGSDSGRSYVVFGSNTGLPNPFHLSTLNGLNGFAIDGEAAADLSGWSASAAGDINGDGIGDLIIGAYGADPNGSYSGRSYVIFGSNASLPNPFNLSTLNGLNGFAINGEAADDSSGFSVSAAGDINGDSIDDLIIGAPFTSPNGNDSGRSYVVFGSNTGLPNPLNLSTLSDFIGTAVDGFVVNGEAASDFSGRSVSAADDVNGDGVDDLIIGAFNADPNGDASGRSYVVFGSITGFRNLINLSALTALNGFAINGEAADDRSGFSVSTAGDFNGDGIDDLIIGADGADPNESGSGRSYIVFGRGDAVFSDRFESD